VDPKKPLAGKPDNSTDDLALNPTVDEFFDRLHPDMRRPLPSQEAVSSARQVMQRLAAESVVDSGAVSPASLGSPVPCEACGHLNRRQSRFCAGCGVPIPPEKQSAAAADPEPSPEPSNTATGQHYFHHHIHHHYFASQQDPGAALAPRAVASDAATAKFRTPGGGAVPMSRTETAVRKVTLDWALACNSRQLDDLVSTYAADALVLRPNHPPVRGTAAIREFFFTALDTGFGEVELDPLRVDIIGDVAYEAGRCKMLVPYVVGKRREERGKYLIVLARQPNGEWRIVSDCWSSDLSLASATEPEPSKPVAATAKPIPPRKP